MANEVVRSVAAGTAPANPIRYGIGNGAAVEKGTIMVFSGAHTIKPSSAEGQIFAGFANTEKVTNDTSVDLGVDTCGIFDCYCTAAGFKINIGDLLIVSGANILVPAKVSNFSGVAVMQGMIVGKALENVTVATSDTIAVAVGIY